MALCEAGVSVTLLHAGSSGLVKDNLRVAGFAALENSPLMSRFRWSSALDTYLSTMDPALYRSLMRVLKRAEIDILQIEGPWSIFHSEVVRAFTDRIPLIYDAHNVESMSIRYSSSVPWMWPYATLLEKKAVERSSAVFCVSESDKTRMCDLYGVASAKITVVPNGVRKSRYQVNSGEQIRKRHRLDTGSTIILFHGALGWRANVEAAEAIIESIAPKLEKENPEMLFFIAGHQPPQKLLRQAERSRNVRILGFVPDIEEYICAANVCIAPLKAGSGTRIKILEYFAAGKPVVATRKAVLGMGIQHGREALLTDNTDEEFIGAIRAAAGPELSKNLGLKARAFAEQFDWSIIAKKVAMVYESILDAGNQ
jgi:glycosyltransferase involved in cell wall biosynthesis